MRFFRKQGVAWIMTILMVLFAIGFGLAKARVSPGGQQPGQGGSYSY